MNIISIMFVVYLKDRLWLLFSISKVSLHSIINSSDDLKLLKWSNTRLLDC